MSLFSLGAIIFGDKSKLIEWMKNKGLLASRMDCTKCNNGTAMVLTEQTEQGGQRMATLGAPPVLHHEDNQSRKLFC